MKLKNYFLLLVLGSLMVNGSAQTKIIAHKSHSGHSSSFSVLLKNNHATLRTSNYGRAPEPNVKNARLDSVIYVSKEISIMVTSEECSNRNGENAITKQWNYALQDWNKALSVSKDKKSSVWKTGRDTLYNHPLFSRNESLDSIKNVIRKLYYFKNDVNDIIFVGYTNKPKPQPKENNYILITPHLSENGIIDAKLNGVFLSSGDCGATLVYGIQEQKTGSQDWQTIVAINSKQMTCGLPYVEFQNSSVQFNIHQFWQSKNPYNQQKFMPSGKYRLFVHLYATQVIVYSNEFYIK